MGSSTKKLLLSGVQPTNQLTLGNYLGALKNWVKLQKDYDCYFLAVDLHSLTNPQGSIRDQTYQVLATYLASGLNPEEATLFVQSHVPEHAELAWIFNCYVYMGELNRMTQFKDKSAKQGQNIRTGLFTYPALMAADILLYQTELVPVGEDQKQHIELTRDIAYRMNQTFGEDLFKTPEPYIPPVGARIMSLQNPSAKMSKSDSDPNATLFLSDPDSSLMKKIKRAVTDSGSEITYTTEKPGVKNLIEIQSAILNKTPQEIVETYVGKQYGHLKIDTAEIVINAIAPIRERVQQLLEDRTHLDDLLKRGAEKAREKASITLEKVYDRVGLVRGRY